MIQRLVKKPRSLAEILSSDDNQEEIYLSDKSKRYKRGQKGLYSRQAHIFDFIHLVKRWESIVGKMLSDNTIPLKIKNSNLFILTKHSIFSNELGMMAPVIIQKIEEEFPYFKGKIKKINFSNGNFSSEEFNRLKEERPGFEEKPKEKPHPFDPKYRARKSQVEKMFEDVEDDEIKNLLINITLN